MSVATDAQISVGLLLPEEQDVPWECEAYNYDYQEWWRQINDYKPSRPIFDESGNWLNGMLADESIVNTYYAERDEWDKNNPCPFEPVNCCSESCPRWILAIPELTIIANRGYPKPLNKFSQLVPIQDVTALLDFAKKYDFNGEWGWWLSSYWEE